MAEIFKIDKSEIKNIDQSAPDKMLDFVVQRIDTEAKLSELKQSITDGFGDQSKTEVEVDMDKIKEYLTDIKDLPWKEIIDKGGAWVIAVQLSLKKMGYDVGKIDGYYGGAKSQTYNAVLKFQEDVNLKLADGDKIEEDGWAGTHTINKMLENRGGAEVLPTKVTRAEALADLKKYHIVGPDANGKYEAEDGYEFIDDADPDNFAVRKKPPEVLPTTLTKAEALKDPAKYHLKNDGKDGLSPEDGYRWIDPNDDANLAVEKKVMPSTLTKTDALKNPGKYYLDEDKGNLTPEDGYEFVESDPVAKDNFAVKKKPPEVLPTTLTKAEALKDPAKYHLIGPDANGDLSPEDGYERFDPDDDNNFAVKKKEVAAGPKELTAQELAAFTGEAKFTLSGGDVYEGSRVNGKPEGKGKYIRKDGDIYEGDFKGGKFEGKGKFTYKSGEYEEGDFKDNGIYNGTKYDKNKNIITVYKDGKEDPNWKINGIKSKFPDPTKDLISSKLSERNKQFVLKGLTGIYFKDLVQADNFVKGLKAAVDQFAFKNNKNKAPFGISDGFFNSGHIFYKESNGDEKLLEDSEKNRNNKMIQYVEAYKGKPKDYKDEIKAVVQYLNGLNCR